MKNASCIFLALSGLLVLQLRAHGQEPFIQPVCTANAAVVRNNEIASLPASTIRIPQTSAKAVPLPGISKRTIPASIPERKPASNINKASSSKTQPPVRSKQTAASSKQTAASSKQTAASSKHKTIVSKKSAIVSKKSAIVSKKKTAGSKTAGSKKAESTTKGSATTTSVKKSAGAVAESLPEIICTARAASKAPDQKWVALTFDDGPSPVYTKEILAVLKENGVHATFCVVGRQVKKCPELTKQIIADGHMIAAHSMNHDEFLYRRSKKKIQWEVLGEKELIESIVPEAKVEYYRAPGGTWTYGLRRLLASWNMKTLGWSVDTKDWQRPGIDSIVNTVKNRIKPGGVILMHDGGGDRSESVAALKKLIPLLKESGYQFSFPG